MYIVRWLAGHPIVAIWALTIIALLMSMSGGGKHDTTSSASDNKHVEATTHTAHVKEAEGATGASIDNAGNTAIVATPATTDKTLTSAHADQTQIDQTKQESISLQGLDDKSVDDLLLMARESYWNNGLDEAVAIYQQLIQREPNVITYKGELGNVYWRQGFPEKSARLYADIAVPMINSGQADRVSNMVGFIGLFHPKKAAEIEKRLQGVSK